MELEFKRMLSNPEELEKRMSYAKDEDDINLHNELARFYRQAGANHPLTKAYQEEADRRAKIIMQKRVDDYEEYMKHKR